MCTIRVAKTKALITAKLICVFVFAYADCWFSHEAAHMLFQTSCIVRKPRIWVCDQVQKFLFTKKRHCSIYRGYVAKTYSDDRLCEVTAQLICAFAFKYADNCSFSDAVAKQRCILRMAIYIEMRTENGYLLQ